MLKKDYIKTVTYLVNDEVDARHGESWFVEITSSPTVSSNGKKGNYMDAFIYEYSHGVKTLIFGMNCEGRKACNEFIRLVEREVNRYATLYREMYIGS